MLFLEKMPDLTNVEYQIYLYVSNHLKETTYMRIRELASATHTSTATIQRFCNKFDCEGFSEFKVRLKLYINQQNSNKSVMLFDTTTYIDFLQRAMQPHFHSIIEEATELLRDKDLIIFLGVGSSNIMAEYGSLYFTSLFQMAVRFQDPVTDPFFYMSEEIVSRSCIIALSVSGETREIIKYLSDFKLRSADIISITNSTNNSVAKLSTINIPYYIQKENIGEQDITSQIPTLYIIELLAKTVHNANHH